MNNKFTEADKRKLIMYGVAGLATGALGYAVYKRFHYTRANEWLVRSGFGIKNIQISKQCIRWPLQIVEVIDITPSQINIVIPAKTSEKLAIELPMGFSIGPENNTDSLYHYASFIMNQDGKNCSALIKGIIEGKARAAAANTAIEEIFRDRENFRLELAKSIGDELKNFGMKVYSSSAIDINDHSGYFESLAKTIAAQAENKAKVEVAERKKIGDIGTSQREGETRQQRASIEATTVRTENEKQKEVIVSKTELEKLRAEQEFIAKQARITAETNAKIYEAEKVRELEAKRRATQEETMRATDLSKSVVEAEMAVKVAEGKALALKLEADALLYKQQREADGVKAKLEAQAIGLQKLVECFGGNPVDLVRYKLVDEGMLEKLVHAQGDAIRGLNPKITVIGSGKDDVMHPIANLAGALPPLIDAVKSTTGYEVFPEWLVRKSKDNFKEDEVSPLIKKIKENNAKNIVEQLK